MARTTIMFTSAPPRTGKTWLRCPKFILDEFLPHYDGIHASNFPVKLDPWKDEAGRDQPGMVAVGKERGLDEDVIRQHVFEFPEEWVTSWKHKGWKATDPVRGPWDQLRDMDISGWHIAFDECQKFCGASHPAKIRVAWQDWLAEIGHMGATIEFISQNMKQVAPEVINLCEIRLALTGSLHEKMPIVGIKWYYWNSLVAKLGGKWAPRVWQRESRMVLEKWETQETKSWIMDRALFGAYNSNNKPSNGGKAGSLGKMEWEAKSWPKFIAWFMAGCLDPLMRFGGIALLVFCLVVFAPQIGWLFGAFPRWVADGATKKSSTAPTAASSAKAPPAAAVAEQPPTPAPTVTNAGARQLTQINSRLTQAEEDRLAEMVNKLEELRRELGDKETAIKEAEEERDQLKSKLEAAFSIASITPESVTFRAGYTYRVGEPIDWGPYEGQSITGIDYKRRAVHLDDERILRMGVTGDRSYSDWLLSLRPNGAPATNSPAPSIPGALSSTGGPAIRAAGRGAATVVAPH